MAFLTVSKMGAGPAMPTRTELEETFGPDDQLSSDEKFLNLQDHCFVGVLRHAEKANLHDKDNPRWKVDVDPPLSRRGDRQAAFTGKYLKEYFEKHNMKFDKIVIESSPFLRCIQTASEVAVALGVDEVSINYLFAEHLHPRDFPDFDPLTKLLSTTVDDVNGKEFKEFNLLSDKVTFKNSGYYREELFKRWPEEPSGAAERAMLTSDYTAQRMNEFKENGDLDDGKKVCYLLFSHGMIVLQMGNMLDRAGESAAAEGGKSAAGFPNPINYKDVTEDQKKAMVDSVKELDWVFAEAQFDEDGKQNS